MSWLFKSRISARDKEAGLALVRHLQKMFAFQQLAVETYNDALQLAGGLDTPLFDSYSQRVDFGPSGARRYLLPALDEKQRIRQTMETEHTAMARPTAGDLRRPYDDFSEFLRIAKERRVFQRDCLAAWLKYEIDSINTTRLDKAEQRAMAKAVTSLNGLIRRLGLKSAAWMAIVCEEYNAVRETVGLLPIPFREFSATYVCYAAGKPARFFARQGSPCKKVGV